MRNHKKYSIPQLPITESRKSRARIQLDLFQAELEIAIMEKRDPKLVCFPVQVKNNPDLSRSFLREASK